MISRKFPVKRLSNRRARFSFERITRGGKEVGTGEELVVDECNLRGVVVMIWLLRSRKKTKTIVVEITITYFDVRVLLKL